MQNDEPAGACCPGGQGVHSDAPNNENVPSGQKSQPELYLLDILPSSHNLQNEEPLGACCPGGHGVHSEEPNNEYVPSGQ